jgi:hypothetical protein
MKPPINKDQSPERVAARMRAVFEMYEDGLCLLKARLQREHPHEDELQIQQRVAAELHRTTPIHDPFLRVAPCPRFSAPS